LRASAVDELANLDLVGGLAVVSRHGHSPIDRTFASKVTPAGFSGLRLSMSGEANYALHGTILDRQPHVTDFR
jgi:hypothetical protein